MSPAAITLLVLLIMVVFFVTEKLPAALVSMLGGSVLVLCGIIEPAQLFSAFSGSTIVLIAAMMVVGSALFHTGIAAKMADILVKLTGTSENGIMVAFMLVATIISAVCSGVAVVAMLLPIVISVSQRAGVSVSRQLIPMSFAASFGCNLTLMGAASNIVVNGALEDLGTTPLSFFELGKVGIPISIAGMVFFLTIGKRFLTPGDTADKEYLAEYTGSNKAVEFNPIKAWPVPCDPSGAAGGHGCRQRRIPHVSGCGICLQRISGISAWHAGQTSDSCSGSGEFKTIF